MSGLHVQGEREREKEKKEREEACRREKLLGDEFFCATIVSALLRPRDL